MSDIEEYRAVLRTLRSICRSVGNYYSETTARTLLAMAERSMELLSDCEPFANPAQRAACLEIKDQTGRLEVEVRETLQTPTPVHKYALVQRVRDWINAVEQRQDVLEIGP